VEKLRELGHALSDSWEPGSSGNVWELKKIILNKNGCLISTTNPLDDVIVLPILLPTLLLGFFGGGELKNEGY
jgi:hypothetical protein